MSKISRFMSKAVQLAKNAVGGRGEVADYTVLSVHFLRIDLEKSYREALNLLSEISYVLGEIGLDAADPSDHSTRSK